MKKKLSVAQRLLISVYATLLGLVAIYLIISFISWDFIIPTKGDALATRLVGLGIFIISFIALGNNDIL